MNESVNKYKKEEQTNTNIYASINDIDVFAVLYIYMYALYAY